MSRQQGVLMQPRARRVVPGNAGWVSAWSRIKAGLYAGAVHLGFIIVVVLEYDPGIWFFVDVLSFELVEGTPA